MKILTTIVLLFISIVSFSQESETALFWPREIPVKEHVITLYQPQLETLNNNILKGRMALSIKNKEDEIIFGALWFDARLSTDLDNRTAVLEKFDIPKVLFPDIKDQTKLEKLKEIIIENLEATNIEMSLDRILASVESVAEMNVLENQLNNAAPDIYFRTTPAVLVSVDGEPKLKKVEDSKLEYVLNTPFFIVKSGDSYFLYGNDNWYKSKEVITKEWKPTKKVPKEVEKLAKKKFEDKDQKDALKSKDKTPPMIIAVSKPSELVLTNGAPEYEPIKKTALLYVTNSESDIIMDINLQEHFLLLNGRWYRSKSLADGDWKFSEPDTLPEDFAKIPADGSSISSIRVSVPGTEEAKEATYEQYMPQTAVIDRKTATVEVTYDGEPKFEKMDGTSMTYAVNTESTVLFIEDTFYCVDNAVWFESSSASGPWTVSDSRPEAVDEIPPSAPVYNVKYVYVYDSTPEVVYVGYTPGYYNSYMYGGVVVYGTGYYYRPWYGSYYYPRPVTYGYGVHYNSYTGWGFAVGVSIGWMAVRHSYYHSYWGAAGYRHGYRHGYHAGYHHGYHNGYRAGYNRGRSNSSSNAYRNRSSGVNRTGDYNRGQNSNRRTGQANTSNRTTRNNTNRNTANNRKAQTTNRANTTARSNTTRPSTKANNMYADKKGNVYQRQNNGSWEQKVNRGSTTNQRSNNMQNRSGNTNRSTINTQQQRNLNQQYNNRSRGTTNYNSYNRNRSSTRSYNSGARSGGSRGGSRGGASRGGGRGRG